MWFFGRRRRRLEQGEDEGSFDGVVIDVHLNARLQPMHRGRLFEDPLQEMLKRLHPMFAVTGSGTMLDKEGRILSCDIGIAVPVGEHDTAFENIRRELMALGAPRGSWATLFQGDSVPLGRFEGVGVRLPRVTTVDWEDADSVPRNFLLDRAMERLTERLNGVGRIASWHVRKDGSDLYIYGPDANPIRRTLVAALSDEEIAEGNSLFPIT